MPYPGPAEEEQDKAARNELIIVGVITLIVGAFIGILAWGGW